MCIRGLILSLAVFFPPIISLSAATFTVSSTADSGAGTLRQAILDANANAGSDVIQFNITSTSKTISPTSAFPTITDPVTIDGASQAGYVTLPIIELNGATPAGADGLKIATSNCVITALTINRFRAHGIEISGGGSNVVQGCLIGLNAAGTADSGNLLSGIYITNSPGNRIGGVVSGARNIISGNDNYGVAIGGSASVGNVVCGNYIGTDVNGTVRVGNTIDGVRILSGDNVVGGAGSGNVISGNGSDGIELTGAAAANNTIAGNIIGANAAGTATLFNSGAGVQISSNASSNRISGGNIIAFNAGDGVYVQSGTNNTIRANSIFANGQQGIDLDPNGITNNDTQDVDAGPNQKQNFPIITSATVTTAGTTVRGYLNSAPNATYLVDVYGAAIDTAGAEGQEYLGSTSVTTDSKGDVLFTASFATATTKYFVTATATDSFGNTSEFTTQREVGTTVPGATFTVTTAADSGAGSLRAAITNANASAGLAKIVFAIPGDTAQVISVLTALPIMTNSIVIDGYTQPGASPNTDSVGFNGVLKIVLDGSTAATGFSGLQATWPGVTIRGLNIVGFKSSHGIVFSQTSGDCVVEGCVIGETLAGTAKGNGATGIFLNGSPYHRIGGAFPAARNVISGNVTQGINVDGGASSAVPLGLDVVIQGNLIGTSLDGLSRVPNAEGIKISAPRSIIGGSDPMARNVISGNNGIGIEMVSPGTNCVVQGNFIGPDATGIGALRNSSYGIYLNSAHGAAIGGAEAGAGNIIAFSDNDGVYITAGTNNTIRANSMHDNAGLGIDIDPNNPNVNDPGDVDTGPNQRQNFPTVTAAIAGQTSTEVTASFSGAANSPMTVDFYANLAADASGYGEGQQYLGSHDTVTDASGNATFTTTLPIAASGKYICATATDSFGNTSEFGPVFGATSVVPGLTITVSNTADSGPGSLRQAILDSNQFFSQGNRIVFNIPGNGPMTISVLTQLPSITNPVTIDGYTQAGSAQNASANSFNAAINIVLSGASAPGTVDGLNIQWGGVTIRGLNIVGFRSDGIELGAAANNCVIEGCLIGLGLDGTDQGNVSDGIFVNGASNVLIGGETAAARNVIAGNNRYGVSVTAASASGNRIVGNLIGIGLTPTRVGNSSDGININTAAHNTTVGGGTEGARNLISGNGGAGVTITGANTTNNAVLGNYIGTDATGKVSANNTSSGVFINSSAGFNQIGGANPGEGNRIAFNNGDGVTLSGSTNNTVRGNSISNNGDLGIDISNNGVTTNDANDVDTGPNNIQNYPVLSGAMANPANTQVRGTLNSRPNTTYTLDFYSSLALESSGPYEGEKYLGSTTVTTDGAGNASFDATVPGVVIGRWITSTATDSFGNTSEFSASIRTESTIPAPTLIVTTTANSGAGSLRQALLDARAFITGEPLKINFQIPGDGLQVITPLSELPAPVEAVFIDGYSQPGAAPNTLSQGDNAVLKIQLSGASAGFAPMLRLTNHGNILRGLSVTEFGADGIVIQGNSNRVEGCFVGLAPDGTAKPNSNAGITISAANSVGASYNLIGGPAPAQRNIISGNAYYGIEIAGGGGTNLIQGNYIGTDSRGTGAQANGRLGISVLNSTGNQIGGAGTSEGNLISGHTGPGISISHPANANNRIFGNILGADLTGANPIPNYIGVQITGGSGNVIGGVNTGEANILGFSSSFGVQIYGNPATNNLVRGNSIFQNGDIGIELGFDNSTANDPNDSDDGPNGLQNYPVLTGATAGPEGIDIAGTLNSLPGKTYAVDFYANSLADTSGHGEGEQFLGSTSVTTDGSGNASFSVNFGTVIRGRFITATATEPSSGTSEFALDFEAITSFPAETFVITNTNNEGPGSLRQAILNNNLSIGGGKNSIVFNIPGGGVQTISPTNQLPTVAHAVIIDGYTQPGASPNTLALGDNAVLNVVLAGSSVSGANGLVLGGNGGSVRGLSIRSFSQEITISGANAQVSGCWIGLGPDGTAYPQQTTGIFLAQGGDNATIGGPAPGDRNVISGANSYGIGMTGAASGARIFGNYIGTSPSGLALAQNRSAGIFLTGTAHTVGAAGAGNVIAGSLGIYIYAATNCVAQGNLIGTDATGAAGFANIFNPCILVDFSSIGNLIGGANPGERNVISGSSNNGISLVGFNCLSNRIIGNFIGTDATGTQPLPNKGVGIAVSSATNQIGGVTEAEGNLIAFNLGNGVQISAPATRVQIRKNRISQNGRLGIELDPLGATANDLNDADSGPNQLQNYPVITSGTIGVSDVQFAGFLQSAANQMFDLDFFASLAPDSSGFGEGDQYLGSATVNTDANGRADFSLTFQKIAVGRFISATATDAQNNTSEFSAAFRAVSSRPPHTFVVTTTDDSGPGSLREALTQSANFMAAQPNPVRFNIPGNGVAVINLATQLPTPSEPVEIDGFTQPGASPNTEVERDNAVRLVQLRGAALHANEDGLRFANPGNIVRGLIVSQFPQHGVSLTSADNCTIEGSLIYSNRINGVNLVNSVGATIGGTQPRSRNLIYANSASGIFLGGSGTADNKVLGNFIGIDATASAGSFRGQNQGIFINPAERTQVGGVGPGEANWIAFNTRGVVVQTGLQNSIRGNRIYSNSSLAIDLGFNNVTLNDAGDADVGANNFQNFPTLQSANITLAGTHLVGALNSLPNATYTIDFYSNDGCDSLGFGEGQRPLGSTTLTTDASGNAALDSTLPTRAPRGVITATATDATGNTSEFSACSALGTEIPPQTFIVTNTDDSGAGSLRQAILDANDAFTTDRNTISFNIGGATAPIVSPRSQLPVISAPTIVDGFTQPGARRNSAAGLMDAILKMRLDGANAGAGVDGLRITGSNVVIRGLMITHFDGAGIHEIGAVNLKISENLIGLSQALGRTSPLPASKPSKKNPPTARLTTFTEGNGIGINGNEGNGVFIGPDDEAGFGNQVAGNTDGGILLDQTVNATLQNATIAANTAQDSSYPGGGVAFFGGTNIVVEDCTLENNTPVDLKAGPSGAIGGFHLVVTDSTFEDNPDFDAPRSGGGIVVEVTSFSAIKGNTISGLDGPGIKLDRVHLSNGDGLEVFNNTISDNTVGIEVDDSTLVNIGGLSPGHENTIRNNSAGGVACNNSFATVWCRNSFSEDNTPFVVTFPPDFPDLFVDEVDVNGEPWLNITGHSEREGDVLLTFFTGTDTPDGAPPLLSPVETKTIPTDSNGSFSTGVPRLDRVVIGVMATTPFGTTTEMKFPRDPNESGNVLIKLSGPTTLLPDVVATFNLYAAYEGIAPVRPSASFYVRIPVPPGFKFDPPVGPTGSESPVLVNGVIVFSLSLKASTSVDTTFRLVPTVANPFQLTATADVVNGDNFSQLDDRSVLSGTAGPPVNGPDGLLGLREYENFNPAPFERVVIDFPVFNDGTVPLTDLKVEINAADGEVIAAPGPAFDPTTLTWTIPNLQPGGRTLLNFALIYPTPGVRTVNMNLAQKEPGGNTSNDHVSFPVTIQSPPSGPASDHGDAPDSYFTVNAHDGPSHVILPDGPVLGTGIDAEPDGLPSADANGDGLDDDGVQFLDKVVPGQILNIRFKVNKACLLDAFADFDGDGHFSEGFVAGRPVEFLNALLEGSTMPLGSIPLHAGENILPFRVPANAKIGLGVARFRVSSNGYLGSRGAAANGEVEDYTFQIQSSAASLTLHFSTDASGNLRLSWDGFGRLQQAPTVNGPFTDGPNGNPVTITPTGVESFFRISGQ